MAGNREKAARAHHEGLAARDSECVGIGGGVLPHIQVWWCAHLQGCSSLNQQLVQAGKLVGPHMQGCANVLQQENLLRYRPCTEI